MSPIGPIKDICYGPEELCNNRQSVTHLDISKGEVQKINKHLYFKSEDSNFSEYSDSMADQEEATKKLLKVRQKHRHSKKKGREIEKKRPLELGQKEKKGRSRRSKKTEVVTLSNSADSQVSGAVGSESIEVNKVGAGISRRKVDAREEFLSGKEVESFTANSSNSSGVRLLVNDQDRGRQDVMCIDGETDPIRVLENSKLFEIQNEAGFNFEVAEDGKRVEGSGVDRVEGSNMAEKERTEGCQ